MRKKLLSMILCVIMVVCFMPSVAFADGDVAEVDGTGYSTLSAAISAAESGKTVKLLANVTEDVTITRRQ